jgi:hypothetical protein
MERGVRKLCLRLDSTRGKNDGAGGGGLQIAQESRLSGARAAEQDYRSAHAVACAFEERAQRSAFNLASVEHTTIVSALW